MDHTIFPNPQETVQFITIFSYLNALSDFLFIENYLSEDNQNRQIPVVNALYEYLEDHHDNQTMKLKLIRSLLKGSDLYGEEENENVDVIFVNAMFEYIITSLVFDKYGNIYGFLADVFRKAKSLEIESLFKDIKFSLRNATFANEFGERSTLTSLAVNRIFTDIILPLFPQPKTNLSVLSLDYIYAQAGSIFLRSGRLNATYYSDAQDTIITSLDQDHLFDEYLTTGFIIDNYHFNNKIEKECLEAFALPALFLYVSTEFVDNENITNIVFDPYYWKAAYENLFSYLDTTFIRINNQLKNDSNYQMHTILSPFRSRLAIVQHFLKTDCKHYLIEGKIASKISDYLQVSEHSKCNAKNMLQSVDDNFMYFVKNVSEMYEKYDSKFIQQAFNSSFLKYLNNTKVIIHLLAPEDKVTIGIFDDATRLPYDLFEFYYPDNNIADYYAIIRENFTTTIIEETDNSKEFQQKIGLTVQSLLSHRYHRINLKTDNQTINEFLNKFLAYKKLRLESYLKFSHLEQPIGEWWKEFGLSLVPFYPCITESAQSKDYKANFCELEDIMDLDQFEKDMSSLITQNDTKLLLSSMGTSIKTIALKNLISKTVDSIFNENKIAESVSQARKNMDTLLEKLSFHMVEYKFEPIFISEEHLSILNDVINGLQNNINALFISVTNIIYNIHILNTFFPRQINVLDENTKQILFISSRYTPDLNTGFGYKYFYLNLNNTAQLRTDYELNRKNFISLFNRIKPNEDIYLTVNNDTFEFEQSYIYVTNNQMQKGKKTILFSGIFTHSDDYQKCNIEDYVQRLIPLAECPRYGRLMQKRQHTEECVNLALSRNANLTKKQILETMAKYTFPDKERIDLKFVEDWINTTDLKIPEWGKYFIIDNSTLLSALKFEFRLDNPNLSIFNGMFRIDSIYSYKERQQIEDEVSIEAIIKDFNDQKVRYVATFEDYYAIRNFAISGYTRITRDTSEAMNIKLALYKLAIRQSDDPAEEFDPTLYRIESKPMDTVNKTYALGKKHILQKFSTTFINEVTAINSAKVAMTGYKNILYEIKFSEPYMRAVIKQFHYFDEKVAILLPGTEFSIVKVTEMQQLKLGDCLRVELKYNHRYQDKYLWYKSIMREILRITSEN